MSKAPNFRELNGCPCCVYRKCDHSCGCCPSEYSCAKHADTPILDGGESWICDDFKEEE